MFCNYREDLLRREYCKEAKVCTLRNSTCFGKRKCASFIWLGKTKLSSGFHHYFIINSSFVFSPQKYGDVKINIGERPRKITVFLNPAASTGYIFISFGNSSAFKNLKSECELMVNTVTAIFICYTSSWIPDLDECTKAVQCAQSNKLNFLFKFSTSYRHVYRSYEHIKENFQ